MSGRIGRASTLVALLAATLMAPAPAAASAQRYDGIVTIKEKIPTRLGEKLYADISFPATDGNAATGRLPVILYYAPYCPGVSQQSWWVAQGPPPSFWTRHGYIHANVQWPGSCGSEGREGFISPELGQAGSDAVEWLARHTWAGKIGMAGVSSPAIAQLHVAARRPPHLTTITPATPTADPYSDIVYPGGILSLEAAAAILGSAVPTWYATGVAARLGDADAARQMLASFGFLPGPAYAEVLSHPLKDRFWTDRTVDMSNVDIPMFLLNSLDDFYTRSTRIFHDTRGRENRLVLGPGGHANPTTQHGLNTELLAWMDRWLKGQQTAKQAKILRKPVEYYVLGAGRWKTADSWPPSPRRMRLHLAAGDSTSGAQGALTTAAEDGGKQRYLYVPGVGTPGALDGLPGASTDKHAIPATALTYATKPLAHDTEVSGDPRLQLSAATTATDADWLVSLIDIVPDGKVQASDNRVGNWVHVTAGQLRASHWRGDSHLEPVPANKAVDYTITLRPTSYLFKKGHRIALQIASADLTHSAGTPIPAINTVFHTSALTLPIGR